MDSKCTVCMVHNPADTRQHTHLANQCSDVDFNDYVIWRRKICYNRNIHGPIYTCCHVPQIDDELYKWISPKMPAFSECPYPDHVLFLVYAIYHCPPAHQAAEANFKEIWGSDSDFARWLCDVHVEKSKTNTMSLVLWFIEKYLYHIL